MIFASGYEVTSELKRRWGISAIEGRGGISLYDHWADGYRTLHGTMAHNFPNLFFMGLIQGGLNVSLPLVFEQQGEHIAWLIKQTMARGQPASSPAPRPKPCRLDPHPVAFAAQAGDQLRGFPRPLRVHSRGAGLGLSARPRRSGQDFGG